MSSRTELQAVVFYQYTQRSRVARQLAVSAIDKCDEMWKIQNKFNVQ